MEIFVMDCDKIIRFSLIDLPSLSSKLREKEM